MIACRSEDEKKRTCLDCRFYSMWEGVCTNPVSRFLYVSVYDYRKQGIRDACEKFIDDEYEMGLRKKEQI